MQRLTPAPDGAAWAATDLDLRDLRCPLPVLRTRKQLAGMAPGQVVRVLCTDPLSGVDIPHLVQQTGDHLVSQAVEDRVQVFTIRKT